MNAAVWILLGLVAVWMLLCVWCGFKAQFFRFSMFALAGLSLNACWMVFGLKADPFSPNAVTAQVAGLMLALSAFGFGWIAGRFARQWHASRVDRT